MTTIDHLGYLTADAVRLHPERLALTQEGLALSYAQLDERADRVAGWLVRRGVGSADRVGLLWANDVRYVEAFLGTMRAGAVAVPLNIRQNDETLEYVLADAGCRAILTGPDQAERAAGLAASATVCELVAGPDELQQAERQAAPPAYSRGDVCMQPYTSGSTGRPKGVPLTHRGQLWCADVLRKIYFFDESDVALLAAPLFHKNAAMTLKAILLAGGQCVVLPGFDPIAVLRAIDRHRVTYLSGVPAMYRMLLHETEELARCDVSSIRFASAGSAPVTVDLLEQFQEVFGAPITEGYGLTEGGPDVLITPRWGINKLGSVGIPIPGCEVQLRGLDGETEVSVGEVGELWVKNPGVTPGYYHLPEVTAQRIRDGWLATRDLMRRDADGYYFFMGRADDLINVGGENVYPKEVEQLLLRHPEVRDVAVVGASHPVKGDVPVAFVVARVPGATTAQDLTTFFHTVGPHYAYPRVIEFVDALPLTGAGKLDRPALEERAKALAGVQP
ncbi:MAG TPA: AMP-binding protein [Acidimicrobiales bacterium]|nr:AMP-binding protein [Acidimicrobiales bacterium]